MITLNEARKTGRLAQFVKDHRVDPKGDADRFNATLTAMARKSKAVPVASNEDGSDD